MAISSRLLNEGERVVVSTRTHWKALIVPGLVLVVCIAGAVLGATLDATVLQVVVGIVVLVVLVWWVIRPLMRWATSTYTITSRRLITRQGIFTRTGHDIPLNRINDVSYEHGLIDRVLGCGTLIISDASTHGRVVLPDVPHVEETHLKLSNLLFGDGGGTDRGRSGGRDDDGT